LGIYEAYALHTISRPLNEPLADLDDVMWELNIPLATWISRPRLAITASSNDQQASDSADEQKLLIAEAANSNWPSPAAGSDGTVIQGSQPGTPRTALTQTSSEAGDNVSKNPTP